MGFNINIGDKIKLYYNVKEFNIVEYIDNDKSFSFQSIRQINLNNRIPIILFEYEEKLLKIEEENGSKIGYTKSFRIDLNKGIEKQEIIINDRNTIQNKNLNAHEEFINILFEINESYSIGLMTEAERKSFIMDGFSKFYRSKFKKGIDEIKKKEIIRKSALSNEDFFQESWLTFINQKDYKEFKTIINGITFFWKYPSPRTPWIDNIILNGIQRGIDKKTCIKLGMGRLYITKKRTKNGKHQNSLNISLIREHAGKLTYSIEFWDKKKGRKKIETDNIWYNKEFIDLLNEVIKSPTV